MRPVIKIAADLSSAAAAPQSSLPGCSKRAGDLRVVFLSRISRIKNLDFALNLLSSIRGSVHFDIYGPVEDEVYWQECACLIDKLPPNIQAKYGGPVLPDQVIQIFAGYHLFLFPTQSENFGHVILESLASGCPVLLSDQTPWHNLEASGAGWNVPLNAPEQYQAILNRCLMMNQTEFEAWSACAKAVAAESFKNQETLLNAYREIFNTKHFP